uniref:Spermatogenesis associated 16 n=1 Tax=Serinus canaria TaxID=9135 RepID=A0A8C9ML38_SERCA
PNEGAQGSADRVSGKRKAGGNGNVSGTKAETAESSTGTFPSPPLLIPPSRLREIEAELICADEVDTEFESGEPAAPAVPPTVPPARAPAVPPAVPPAGPPTGAQAPAQGPGDSRCKGFALEDPLKSSPDGISRLASWIESKLVICYLKLGQPGLALHHSHRSIIQNPSHFCNHLRQAACFRSLHRYSEAARSAMVAQCLYVLAEGAAPDTSDLLQLYWQAMAQEALSEEVSFSVLYTPFDREDKADKIKEANKTFAEKHPDYVQHIFTDPHGIHLLPEKAESHPGQQYLLTLGFRNKEIGKTVEKFVTQKLPVFPGVPTETFWQNTGKRIMAALAFTGSSKIKVRTPFPSGMWCQFHHASLLSHLQRGEEQAQVMAQAMAELATVPYLQRISQEDDKLLQSLMADAMDILAGGTGERVWTKIQKVTACSKGQESSLLLGQEMSLSLLKWQKTEEVPSEAGPRALASAPAQEQPQGGVCGACAGLAASLLCKHHCS